MSEPILPDWARQSLIGKTIESVSEDAPHALRLYFRGGDSLTVTAMSFEGGVLDASMVVVSDMNQSKET